MVVSVVMSLSGSVPGGAGWPPTCCGFSLLLLPEGLMPDAAPSQDLPRAVLLPILMMTSDRGPHSTHSLSCLLSVDTDNCTYMMPLPPQIPISVKSIPPLLSVPATTHLAVIFKNHVLSSNPGTGALSRSLLWLGYTNAVFVGVLLSDIQLLSPPLQPKDVPDVEM